MIKIPNDKMPALSAAPWADADGKPGKARGLVIPVECSCGATDEITLHMYEYDDQSEFYDTAAPPEGFDGVDAYVEEVDPNYDVDARTDDADVDPDVDF